MRLSAELLDRVDEFFDLIVNEVENQELDFAMDSLFHFLEKNDAGWTNYSNEDTAIVVQERIEEIWALISDQEKADNSLLEDHYRDMMDDLSAISACDGIETEEEKECDSEDCQEDSDDDVEEEEWD